MKVLIAIRSCHAFRARAEAQRRTWVQDVPAGVDVRFFLGRGPARRGGPAGYEPLPDEVLLDVLDTLPLAPKVQAICCWAVQRGYDYVCKVDDDVYLRPERLLASGFERWDYSGRLRGPTRLCPRLPAPFCSGFCVWLSRRSAAVIACAEPSGEVMDDAWLGNVLWQAGIRPHGDDRYALVQALPNGRFYRNLVSGSAPPRVGNDIIAACEYGPGEMADLHRLWHAGTLKPAVAGLPEVWSGAAVVFMPNDDADRALPLLAELGRRLRSTRLIVVDDGFESRAKLPVYSALRRRGHIICWLPRGAGAQAKAQAARACMRQKCGDTKEDGC